MNIGKRASDFIRKSTKAFNKDNSVDNENNVKDYYIDSPTEPIVEERSDKLKESSPNDIISSIVSSPTKSKLEGLDRKFRDNRFNKLEQNLNNRIDKIEGRMFTLENYGEDRDKTLIAHEEKVESLERRISSLESRNRIVEEREEFLEKDIKLLKSTIKSKEIETSKFNYDALIYRARKVLLDSNYKREKSIFTKCILSLSLIILASILMGMNTPLSILLSSIFIIVTILVIMISLLKNIPNLIRFIAIKKEEINLDKTIVHILKIKYDEIDSLKANKKFGSYDDIIDLDEFVKIEKKSMRKNAINICITFVVALIFSLFLNRYVLDHTPYYFKDILMMPLSYLNIILGF